MRYWLIAFSLCLVIAAAGCPAGKLQQAATAPEKLQAGGVLRLPLELSAASIDLSNPNFEDPRLFALARASAVPLVRCDAQGALQPGLASAWQVSPDGTEWTFTLQELPAKGDPSFLANLFTRRLVLLVSGLPSPLQAQCADLITGAADLRDGKATGISGLTVSGPQLTIRLTRPDQAFGAWLSQPALSLLDLKGLRSSGFGLFAFSALDGDDLRLTANPASLVGKPVLDELHFICQPDRSKQLELYLGGQLDAANLLPATADPGADPRVAAERRQLDSAAMLLGFFDLHEYPWGEGEFQSKLGLRQAVNWSLDRGYLAEQYPGLFNPWPHFLPPCWKDYLDQSYVSAPPFPLQPEIEQARDGLLRADNDQGIRLPREMQLDYPAGMQLDGLAADICQYMEEISVKLTPEAQEPQQLRQLVAGGAHQIVLAWAYPAYPDPDALLYPLLASQFDGLTGNWSMLKDTEVDSWITGGQALDNGTDRQGLYRKLTGHLEQQALLLFVGNATPQILLKPGLGGLTLSHFDYDASLPGQDFARLGWK